MSPGFLTKLIGLATLSLLLAMGSNLVPRSLVVNLASEAPVAELHGFHDPQILGEADGRWTNGDALVRLPHVGPFPAVLRLRLAGHPERVGDQAQVVINQDLTARLQLQTSLETFHIAIPDGRHGGRLNVVVRSAVSRDGSGRLFGIFVDEFEVRTGGLAALIPASWAAVFWATLLVLSAAVVASGIRPPGLGPPGVPLGTRPLTAVSALAGAAIVWLVLTTLRFSVLHHVPRAAMAMVFVAILGMGLHQPRIRVWLDTRLAAVLQRTTALVARPLVLWSLTLLPALYLMGLVATFHVDVPSMDQWELVPQLDRLYLGTLSIHDLWAQHNEHRPLFPRLIMLTLAWISHWNTAYELASSIAIAAATLALIALHLHRSRRSDTGYGALWVLPIVSVIVFSASQWENWLWGWQLQIFLSVLAVVTGLLLISNQQRSWTTFAGSLAMGIVATYSFASGLLYWVVGLLAVGLGTRPRGRRLAIWMAVSALVMTSYFHGFRSSPDHPSMLQNFQSLDGFTNYVTYAITYLGAPLSRQDQRAAEMAGLSGLVAFGILTAALRRHPRVWPHLVPYVLMGLYAIAGAAVTALGRAGFGVNHALSSRYTTVSSLLWLAIVVLLGWVATQRPSHEKRQGLGRGPLLAYLTIAIIAVVTVRGSHEDAVAFARWHRRLEPARRALMVCCDDRLLSRLYPDPNVVRQRLATLKTHRLSVFRDE